MFALRPSRQPVEQLEQLSRRTHLPASQNRARHPAEVNITAASTNVDGVLVSVVAVTAAPMRIPTMGATAIDVVGTKALTNKTAVTGTALTHTRTDANGHRPCRARRRPAADTVVEATV